MLAAMKTAHPMRTAGAASPSGDGRAAQGCWARRGLAALGWLCVGLGMVGVVLPGLPTTVFLIVALWAFSRSSERFRVWLWDHPRFGPPLRAWHRHRVIPLGAKLMATATMTASLATVGLFVAESWLLPMVLAAIMAPVAAYLLTRPGRAPEGGH